VDRDANEALREQLAAVQVEAAELRGRSTAINAPLEREVVDQHTLQQEIEHVRRERQAARQRIVQAQAEIFDERRRLQATEELVTRLKVELKGMQRANERRR
jgi:hypothetical protein